MGVQKYRSVEAMPGPPARRPLDPANLRIALGMAELADHLSPRRREPGVRKFRSYGDLISARERIEKRAARPGAG